MVGVVLKQRASTAQHDDFDGMNVPVTMQCTFFIWLHCGRFHRVPTLARLSGVSPRAGIGSFLSRRFG